MFTKRDLKSGMIIKIRRGEFYVVIENAIIGSKWDSLDNYYEDLSNIESKNLDIMKIWEIDDDLGYLKITKYLERVEERKVGVRLLYDRENNIDWNKVEVDTKVLVKDLEHGEWILRYFSHVENGKVYCFSYGRTSFTRDDDYETSGWNYARLYKE